MENLDNYRQIIKKVLTEYYQMTVSQVKTPDKFEVSDRLAFDEIRDQYLWFRFGWEHKKQVQRIIIYICIKESKVWVEEDSTDLCVVDDLLSEGIPQNQIVLGFHHPSKRGLTEFAST